MPRPPDAEPEIVCEHAARCGGCALIDLPYAEQLAAKAQRVTAALTAHGLAPPLEAVRGADPRAGYRTRAKLVVSPGGAIGLYARGGHEVVDIPGCRVLPPVALAAVAALRGLLPGSGVAVRGLDLRVVEDEAGPGLLVSLVVAAPLAPDSPAVAALADRVAGLPGVRGVAASARSEDSPRVLGGEPRVLRGPAALPERMAPELPFQWVAHGAFVQAHRGQARALQDAVVDGLRAALGELRGARVLELFAGSGGLGLRLSAAGARPVLVESQASAAEAARAAAARQDLALEVRADDAGRAAAALAREGARFDALVVNPPRRGLPARLRVDSARLARRSIVYVSCEPGTLARDLAHLEWLGWRAQQVVPFDLIPQSAEVETLARLAPAAPPALRVLFADAQAIAVDAPPHLPLTAPPGHPACLLDLVRREWPEATPVQRPEAGASGVCLFARTPDHAPAWARALAAGSQRALALVRGIARAKGSVRRPPAGADPARDARTRYRRVQVIGGHSLLHVWPEPASRPQIRRHLAALGHPVLGDTRHGHAPSNRHLAERHALDRPFLHCAEVRLAHPETGAALHWQAPLAPDLAAVLANLGAQATRG